MMSESNLVRPELRIWGKSKGLSFPYPLLAHLVDTAAIAYSLLRTHLPSTVVSALGIDRRNDEQLRGFACLAGLHDTGKITPGFESQDESSKGILKDAGFEFPAGSPLRHDKATQLSIPEALTGMGINTSLGGPLEGTLGIACMLGGHHGIFHRLDKSEFNPAVRSCLLYQEQQLGTGLWEKQRIAHVEALFTATGAPRAILNLHDHQLVLGAGVVMISDWLASQESNIGSSDDWPVWENVNWVDWFDSKVESSSDIIQSAGLSAPTVSRQTFIEIFNKTPRPLQDTLEKFFKNRDSGAPGILFITAPMGIGKTEAALLASQYMGAQDSGVLFLLPTMATADAMFDRVVDYAEQVVEGEMINVSLVHSMASLNKKFDDLPKILSDDDTVVMSAQWLRGRHRSLLAPIAAGTIDQLLAASLKSRRGFLRWLGFSGKTVIIDEAHSFDAYMHGLLCTALRWLGRFGVPVIVMSATLPKRILTDMMNAWCEGAGAKCSENANFYPGWMFIDHNGPTELCSIQADPVHLKVNTICVSDWENTWRENVQERLAPIENEGCALVICNTVGDAQSLARSLESWAKDNGVDLICLHARFRQNDRRRITQEVLAKFGHGGQERPSRAVLIATQIVEQSLDVDFDVVISCLAPVAALLQRAGRGHRHPERKRPHNLDKPTLEVLVPVDSNGDISCPTRWGFVYPIVYTERTWRYALKKGEATEWVIPEGVQGLVDDIYGYGDLADVKSDEALLAQLDQEWLNARANSDARIPVPDAMASLADLTAPFDDELLLATRLGLSSTQVICVWDHPSGHTLDREGRIPVPSVGAKDAIRSILNAAVPVNQKTGVIRSIKAASNVPNDWANDPWLNGAATLILNPDSASTDINGWHIFLDPLVGLCWERV